MENGLEKYFRIVFQELTQYNYSLELVYLLHIKWLRVLSFINHHVETFTHPKTHLKYDKSKEKLTLEQTIKAQRGNRGIALLFL
jgi:hypothetical protein